MALTRKRRRPQTVGGWSDQMPPEGNGDGGGSFCEFQSEDVGAATKKHSRKGTEEVKDFEDQILQGEGKGGENGDTLEEKEETEGKERGDDGGLGDRTKAR
ncbi:hypothetical protein L6164_020957 [Bauhinia variegata]|uniref:Uncharacterized protein n=1 Tax=Bauhinia variegata TaxID=167791 RepID=A0ACB9MXI0_BAUVA|nr:hypothetical protein L6164_020957 [Bauhinia variegata]